MNIRLTLIAIFLAIAIKSSSQCQLNISYTPESCFNCCDGAATVTVSGASIDCQPYYYQWSTTPPQNTTTAVSLCAGTYTVIFGDNWGVGCCGSMSTSFTIPPFPTIVSDHIQPEIEYEIFPNPVTNELTIENGKWKMEKIELCNTVGEKVFERHLSSDIGHLSISVADFPPGIYFITVTNQTGNKVTKKVVKM